MLPAAGVVNNTADVGVNLIGETVAVPAESVNVLLLRGCAPVNVATVESTDRVIVLPDAEDATPPPFAKVSVPPPETDPVPDVPASEIDVLIEAVDVAVIRPYVSYVITGICVEDPTDPAVTVDGRAIVTAEEPSNDDPDNIEPIVNAFTVVAFEDTHADPL
jgi:hypothetical protein